MSKVFIKDLDEELADVETEDARLIFLPDIEQHFNRIPQAILQEPNGTSVGKELVLYNIPESLSIPQEQDNVRKAIIESRQRVRDRQAQSITMASSQGEPQSMGQITTSNYGIESVVYDEDAMDTD